MILLSMNNLRELLNPLKEEYEVVLFGSSVDGGMRPKSDIDIAILSRKKDKRDNMNLQKELLGRFPQKFDVRVFELYPIYVQISIIENYKVIFGDPLEISEYFYYFRKKWNDCRHRILSNQFTSYRERLPTTKE